MVSEKFNEHYFCYLACAYGDSFHIPWILFYTVPVIFVKEIKKKEKKKPYWYVSSFF